MHLINQMAHKTPPKWIRSDVQDLAMKTQMLESPEALPITCNEPTFVILH
jgi:hypothetical protein